jgi:hypothetical protein
VATTHFRGDVNIGAVEGAFELWVDDADVVRRERQRGPGANSFETVRDYYDFGVEVGVRRPKMGGSR